MGVYVYRQNNSGGCWDGPSLYILCEASAAETADRMAEAAGAYFDGCAAGRDCDCCGDRWARAWGAPDYDTMEAAIAAADPSLVPGYGDLYVIVRGGFQIGRQDQAT